MLMINGHAKYSPDGSEAPAYIVEIPDFDLMTQAETLDECLDMAKDAVSLMFEDAGVSQDFEIRWQSKGTEEGFFSIVSSDVDGMIAFILKRKRGEAGLTLAQLAKILGFSSHNSIAAYELKERSPTVEKLAEIAQGLGYELVISLQKNKSA